MSVGQGACPDTVDSRGTCTNDATVVGGFRDDSQQCVTFTRPLTPGKILEDVRLYSLLSKLTIYSLHIQLMWVLVTRLSTLPI